MVATTQVVEAQPEGVTGHFSAANDAYAQGQYGRAVEAYHDILQMGYESGALFYNLGNAYARLDQWGQAIRYYEKARQLRPDDSRILHNLEQVRRKAGLSSKRNPERFEYGFGAIVKGWSPLTIFVGGWLLFLTGLSLLVIWMRPEGTMVYHHPWVWGPITAGLLGITLAISISYVQSTTQYAVMVADEVPLRAAPEQGAAADSTLPEGAILQLKHRHGRWQAVELSEGTGGWVSVEAVGEI